MQGASCAKQAYFFWIKVGRNAVFDNAEFDGPAYFAWANIAGNFQASGTKFHDQEQGASFQSMRVAGDAVFNAAFDGPLDLRYADFGRIILSRASWPKDADNFHMQGISYKYLLAFGKDKTELHKPLLEWAKKSSYTADVYSKLEEFFARQGYRADADEAFIEGKLRERDQYSLKDREVREYFLSGDWLRWLGSTILYHLVGYGRRPWKAGIPCVALVALGCVLFSPKKMEPRNPAEAPRVYNRFWYSLGVFLPFVDLQADKVWKPKADQTFLRNYMRVHALLGWILIPIVLAALTGLIK
jgi:hypothetical protein